MQAELHGEDSVWSVSLDAHGQKTKELTDRRETDRKGRVDGTNIMSRKKQHVEITPSAGTV